MKTIKKGSKGEDVRVLQRILNLVDDGIFGEITEEAVIVFQKSHTDKNGKPLVADGIVGAKTWAALEKVAPTASIGTSDSLSGVTIKKSRRRINLIVVHCTATEEGKDYSVEWIRKVHKNKGYADIGYHYVIYRDGSLHLGRNVDYIGAHAKNHNANSIGVVYIGGCPKGDTHKNKDTRTDAQKKTMLALLKKLRSLYPYASIVGHKDVNATGCPSFDAKNEYKAI